MALEELRALIARHAAQPDLPLDGVTLSSAPGPTAPDASVAEPVLALAAQGAKRLTLAGRTHEYGAGRYLVVCVGLPVTGHVSEAAPDRPFLGLGLRLRPAAIAALLLDAAAHSPARSSARSSPAGRAGPRGPLGLAVGTADRDLLDALVRLLRLADRPADRAVLAPMVEREILWRLLTGEHGATVRQMGLADSRLSHVGRAIGWIRDHYADRLAVEDLAGRARMSLSSFHRHFRAVTAMTPLQFQKHVRLQQARLRLLADGAGAAEVGLAVGYDSASQFTREYRRQFGLPPGQDARRLRACAPREVAGVSGVAGVAGVAASPAL